MLGTYTVAPTRGGAVVTITELPLMMWSSRYAQALEERLAKPDKWGRQFTGTVSHRDNNDRDVRIAVTFSTDELAHIREHYNIVPGLDPIVKFLGIYLIVQSQLNFINIDGAVVTMADYKQPLCVWFARRRAMYIARMQREILVARLQIDHVSNVVRYVEMCARDPIDWRTMDEAAADARLAAAGFARFARSPFGDLTHVATAELEVAVRGVGGFDTFAYLPCWQVPDAIARLDSQVCTRAWPNSRLIACHSLARLHGGANWRRSTA